MNLNHEPEAGATRRPDLILLIDDDASVREMVGRVLVEEGYRILTAATGAGALALATATPPDLVLLDLNLPGHSGWDTFEKLTSLHPTTAVIVITARPDQRSTALAAGVHALLEKPFDFPKLLEAVHSALWEPPEVRLARLTGRRKAFRYWPAKR